LTLAAARRDRRKIGHAAPEHLGMAEPGSDKAIPLSPSKVLEHKTKAP
jgi:hypothetical protein